MNATDLGPLSRGALLDILDRQIDYVDSRLQGTTSVHPFLARMFVDLGISAADLVAFIQEIGKRKKELVQSSKGGAHGGIGRFTHRIWMTDESAPTFPPAEYVAQIAAHCRDVSPDWTNIFWSNSPEVRAKIASECCSREASIVTCDPVDLSSDPLFASVCKLTSAKKYVLAADLLRFIVLRRFGGLYSDLGIRYSRDMLELMLTCDYVFFLGGNLFFQTSLLASAPDTDLVSLFYGILLQPSVMPVQWCTDGQALTGEQEVSLLAGPGFTAAIFSFLDPAANCMVCSNDGREIEWESRRSWYGSEPKYGNVLIADTSPTLVSLDELLDSSKRATEIVTGYGCPNLVIRQLQILSLMSGHFEAHPTAVCRAFRFNGSDKALGWHNYGSLYRFLLNRYVSPGDNILEIGLGTNYEDIPSSMGKAGVPGASLRVWKDFLPTRIVYGADVDRRVLFQDEGIRTLFVDQTDCATLQDLVQILDRPVSLVIDDGLHTFEANRNVMNAILEAQLGTNLIIIEDIAVEYIALWHQHLSNAPFGAALVRIPHGQNARDNALIFALPGIDCSSSHVPTADRK